MDVSEEQRLLRQFAHDRDWEQFHSPKNLAMALAGEVGELVALFQWLTPEQSAEVMVSDQAEAVREELADVVIYALRLADVLEIDLTAAVNDKLQTNAARYSVDRAFGSAAKQ